MEPTDKLKDWDVVGELMEKSYEKKICSFSFFFYDRGAPRAQSSRSH